MNKDIFVNSNGDMLVSVTGDLASVEHGGNMDRRYNILRALQGDNAYMGIDLPVAANLSEFRGKNLTDEMLDALKERITDSVHALYTATDIEFQKPLVGNNTLVIFFTVKFPGGEEILFRVWSSEEQTYVNYAN